ncbi:lytic transglycosylase domain-containing protein [Dictyobacter kobayashii]|uniref:Transglycosylase SLT domain-containing protein n=1 Tax=Dictyobacter kobayashii TaxID=2014872 RepID=A0A402AKP7_9CHLR|nr:lytic transglycosylase domain-containing protein [Dictyobacter kobayashii]GCE19692.1 hypothetical protein KDK_34920 [Dictyobacter kobayashii]
MSQFQSMRSLKKNPPGDPRANTNSVASAADANVTHNVPVEPETMPMPTAPVSGSLLRSPFMQRSSKPASRVQVPVEPTSESGLNVESIVEQRNLPAVRTTGQLYPQPISISFPLSNVPTTPVPERSRAVRNGKAPLVIPGARKRLPDTDAIDLKEHHLPLRWRHSLAIVATLGTFLIMMLSLTPVGVKNGAGINGLFQWTSVPRSSDVNLLSRSGSGNPAIDGFTDPMDATKAKYVALAREDALKYGISPDLYVRQIQQESHFDPNAYSYVGAIGIAQFMPATAAEMGFDPSDPVAALNGGAKFMGSLNDRFNGDYAKALAAYNAGPGAVDNAVNNCGGAWLSCMDPQAQAYVYIIEGW